MNRSQRSKFMHAGKIQVVITYDVIDTITLNDLVKDPDRYMALHIFDPSDGTITRGDDMYAWGQYNSKKKGNCKLLVLSYPCEITQPIAKTTGE